MAYDFASVNELVAVLVKEGRRRLVLLSGVFAAVAVLALAIGLVLPKRYDASTLILIETDNSLKLVDGHTGPTIGDQTAVINQIVLGRKIMREVLAFGGWVKDGHRLDPREEERLMDRLRAHIKIETVRDEMIRISYSDSDPQRTYKIANKLAEIYLRESDAGKERQSREAFEFIDKQVTQYGAELADIHEKVLAQYRGDGVKASSAPEAEPTRRAPRSKIPDAELAELRVEEAQLQAQVSRKPAPPAHADPRAEEQARARVQQLNAELERLSTTFTDEHPDVKRVKRELAGAQEELDRIEQVAAGREASSKLAARLDDEMAQAARTRLADVQRRIAAATGEAPHRPAPSLARPASEETVDPEMRSVGRDATLSELLRQYEAARDAYHSLLRRRYDAKVAMDAAAEHRGLTLRIQEAAELPASASGLRLMHIALISLFVAVLIPLGLLFMLVRFDRRVRSPRQIDRLVPLLASISDSPGHRERSRFRTRGVFAALMVATVFLVYVAVFLIKLKTSS